MIQISERPGGISYREARLSVWIRLAVGILGLSMLAGCAVFASFGRWMPPAWTDLLATIGALAFLAFAGICFLVSFSSVKTLDFDEARRSMHAVWEAPLGRWSRDVSFAEIDDVSAVRRESEDGAYSVILIHIAGDRRALELVEIGDKAEAEAWRERLDAIVGAAARRLDR